MRMKLVLSLVPAVLMAACGTYSAPPPMIQPLPAAPTSPVASQTLPPPITMPTDQMAAADAATGAGAAAAMPSAATATEVRKTDLIGGWTLASAGETCQLSMNLTTWTGGYRASTRGCASDELKSIGAWDLNGKEVLLKDASGAVVARLLASAPTRFSGQTDVSKRGVQFFRG
ncbi:AprI/Inh family metalloprotease inhibitor [Oryzibacter oryziterrae]|uniref:AprI/Inh family metalloprotease inhibitor n=1 Tax=Oryzibacter oryziterrae TaxID=2766474 RepID=UPI001F317A93|nr:AprI/Inh family metalloprotease inhibitor [Oryzibacter oryziterrae]